ncbi:MAG TPA: proprotein convertase P-domain-containing protein [Kofleriaceae bacterium]|nr:proprotein convertase P-domain-containing protein [Kofleriaceae bacterium]
MLLLTSVNLIGCAADSSEDECLPGDIDCAPAGADGKADGFDFKNDPVRMSQHLNYRLAELPKTGKRTNPVWKNEYPAAVGVADVAWADTYWPTSEGSHNNRWQGDTVKSPLEKYDAAFNNAAGCAEYPSSFYGSGAKAEWDKYYACAGPAAKWQSQEFQGGGEMHDGIDNDGDGKTDEFGSNGVDGIEGWWGTCHAWSPASMLVPEPQHSVDVNGVTFEVGDIKALAQNAFDSTSAVMLGGRCNSREISHTVTGSANDECSDVNPGALHIVMTNFLGIANLALVEDRTANFEVWNQPVMGYDITKQDKVTASAANSCVGATGDTWKYNTSARELYEVNMTVQYLTEGHPSTTPLGSRNNIRTDRYHYILELNSDGKVIGGRYCTDSENSHVDFLWSPTGSFHPSNPNVNVSKVKELIAKSVAPVGGGGGGGNEKVFTATPAAPIPDNSSTGVSVDLAVAGLTGSPTATVNVDITHTYRGDLLVELYKDGTKVKTLSDRTGGSQANLVQSYTLTSSEAAGGNGKWTLKVTDTAAVDTGTVNKFEMRFAQ